MTIRKKGSISIRSIQKLLGLQIWISTVFRVARQFLTSTCDILRVTSRDGGTQFLPVKHAQLVKRVVFDFKFWRRFVACAPKASFDFFLGRLPENSATLSSDASAS